ncbi:MAG: GGDEF domain-containing protein [Gammaproteobacteria bacterium]|nr:GGDEF domain-containing protein [Gammaproteobacteria bacterium]NIR84801.1 GGDEF domain-containing protein [Gammaproteobacteria bacterium]NIR91515.1 GGDEF domain-containing protein [Gammaproteobacteria bacterium]NIU05848.1 GGDEF domain-containing protein [Gammaproteobacteria bacterium]NIV76703.1 diguanylate cyclase [Gammaproteobacteria bacterium]
MCPLSSRPGPCKELDFPEPDALLASREFSQDARVPHALKLAAVLQSVLELEPLLRLFSREVAQRVPHSGLVYHHEQRGLDVVLGRRARHACAYRLSVERRDVGHVMLLRGRSFTQVELAAFEELLGGLVYPLRNALRYRDALEAALTDPLTGVYNRSFLDGSLRREIGLARRHRTPLSLLILDVDGLKQINDRHGHRVGDALIRAVANAVADCRRKTDILARYGGDEFVLLLTNTGRRGAAVLARYIADKVDGLHLDLDGRTLRVSVSLGAATLTKDDTGADLIARADRALYAAKRERRRIDATSPTIREPRSRG